MTTGRFGEKFFEEKMKQQGLLTIDVSGNSSYFDKDIDFLVKNEEGRTTTVEVKCDTRIHNTGNMFIEVSNPRSKGGNGWFTFIQAEFLAYEDIINKTIYMLKVSDLKKYIAENESNLRTAFTFDGSKGYLINVNKVRDLIYCIL